MRKQRGVVRAVFVFVVCFTSFFEVHLSFLLKCVCIFLLNCAFDFSLACVFDVCFYVVLLLFLRYCFIVLSELLFCGFSVYYICVLFRLRIISEIYLDKIGRVV